VDIGQVNVRSGGYDRATLNLFAMRIDPLIPQSRECEDLAIANFKAVRLLVLAALRPLVETICGNQAALSSEAIAE